MLGGININDEIPGPRRHWPRGLETVLKAGRLPEGEPWARWLRACCDVQYRRAPRLWPFLLGLNVGLLEASGDYAEFRRVKFHRAEERSFVAYMMLLADALTGTDDRVLVQVYPGLHPRGLRRKIPRSVLYWPEDETTGAELVRRLTEHIHGIPLIVPRYPPDFRELLMLGYSLAQPVPSKEK